MKSGSNNLKSQPVSTNFQSPGRKAESSVSQSQSYENQISQKSPNKGKQVASLLISHMQSLEQSKTFTNGESFNTKHQKFNPLATLNYDGTANFNSLPLNTVPKEEQSDDFSRDEDDSVSNDPQPNLL